jgi:deoxycytidine triphosphate deaminase
MEPGSGVGVLGRIQIQALIDSGKLVKGAVAERLQGASYDMSVGKIFSEGKVLSADQAVIVPPGGLVSIFTAEELVLPANISATAFAINRMSSKGLLVLNPGHVDPGFEGPLTVKALNVRKVDTVIHAGEPIFTIVFEQLAKATDPYRHNSSRADRERAFNTQNVENSPRTLADLILLDPNAPYPDKREVREMIREHWMSRLSFWFSTVAAVASVVAVILALRPSAISSQVPDASAISQKFERRQLPIVDAREAVHQEQSAPTKAAEQLKIPARQPPKEN